MKVYLAGPISGLTYEESSDWRKYCEQEIYQKHELFNPLLESDKDFTHDDGKFGNGKELEALTSDKFFTRDLYWTRECDVILANFSIVPEKLGAGTVYELGYAHALNKTIILVGPEENIPLFPVKGADIRFQFIEDAINYINTF